MTELIPKQKIPAGTALSEKAPLLFSKLNIRGADFQNRIWVSPMCMYSAVDGHLTDFHFAHYAALAFRGPSLTIVEATAVSPEGRISPHDSGLWADSQAAGVARVARFAHQCGQKIGIQLAHAGRKASTKPLWQLRRGKRSEVAGPEDGGWPEDVIGPTSACWGPGHADPRAMTVADIRRVVADFAAAAKRAVRAGVDVVEIHGAHGYLISSFLSPRSNTRRDSYGGSLENRMRLALDVTDAVRAAIPNGMPLVFRVSATEWVPPAEGAGVAVAQWDAESTVRLAVELARRGVDLITISTGGNSAEQKLPATTNYQVDIARVVRRRLREQGCPMLVGAVGRITEPRQAALLLQPEGDEDGGEAAGDVILIGRQFLKEPNWVLRAARELQIGAQWPVQYQLGRHGLETKL